MKTLIVICSIAAALFCSAAHALSLYVGRGAGTTVNDANYFYGGSRWHEITAAIDSSFDSVTVAPDLTDLNAMLQYDRLWVDSRAFWGSPLSSLELTNIRTFIATGRHTVLMGDRSEAWCSQILSLVGGSWAGEGVGIGVAHALPIEPELTSGVNSIDFSGNGFGQSLGGTPLFDRPWSALWGGNVLTVLDLNVFDQ